MQIDQGAIKIAVVGAVGIGVLLLLRSGSSGAEEGGASYQTLVGTPPSAAAYEYQTAALLSQQELAATRLSAGVQLADIQRQGYSDTLAAQVQREQNILAATLDAYKARVNAQVQLGGRTIIM